MGMWLDDRKQWGVSWLLLADPLSPVPLCSAPVRGAGGLPKQNQEGAGHAVLLQRILIWSPSLPFPGETGEQVETELLSQIVSGGPETKEEETGEVDGAAATEIGMLTEERRTAWVIAQEAEAVLSLVCTSCPCPWVQLLLFAVYDKAVINIFIHVKKYCCFLLSVILLFFINYLYRIHSNPDRSVILW